MCKETVCNGFPSTLILGPVFPVTVYTCIKCTVLRGVFSCLMVRQLILNMDPTKDAATKKTRVSSNKFLIVHLSETYF